MYNENNIKQSTLGTWISKESKMNNVVNNQKLIEATPVPKVKEKLVLKFIEVKIGDFTISLTEDFKLPVEIVIHDLSEENKDCPICGEDMHIMSEEIRRELKIIPAQVKIIEHHSYVYSCRNCEKIGTETPVITAPSSKGLIPKSLVSPSMMAYVINQKFVNAQPLYRQEAEFKRMDILLSRQTLSNWMIKGESLLKV